MIITCLLLFWKAPNSKWKGLVQVRYNKSLANFACSSSSEEYWSAVVFVRTSGKCSLVWPSELIKNYHLQLRLNLSAAMKYMKWVRDSWFHFNIFDNNLWWCGGHGHHVHHSIPPLFLFSCLLLLHRERHTPCRTKVEIH